MRKAGRLARRYARALLNALLKSGGSVEAAAGELESIAAAFATHRDLRLALFTPMFSAADRERALLKILQESKSSADLTRFVSVLFGRSRLDLLSEIAQAFRDLADEATRRVAVEVRTAKALSPTERVEAEMLLRKALSDRAVFRWEVEPELIGGMMVHYRGKIIDGSLRGRLESIERELLIG